MHTLYVTNQHLGVMRLVCLNEQDSWMAWLSMSFSLKGRRKMNASVAIQVLPKVNSDEEVIRVVDEVIAYIKSTGLNYFVGPCETSIEGDYDELMDIVKECQKIAVRAGAKSVSAYVKINYRPEGEVLTIEKKVTKHHI